MKTTFIYLLIFFVWQVGKPQSTVTADLTAVHNYTWRFYNYNGPFAQSFCNISSRHTNWDFSFWSNFGLNAQTNILEFAPYLNYNIKLNDANSFVGGATYYFVSPPIDSGIVQDIHTNTGEVYFQYFHTGKALFSVRLFFDPFFSAIYGVSDLEKTFFSLGKGDFGGFLQAGMQYGVKDHKEGFSNGAISLKWARTFKRTFTLTLMTGLSYLGTGNELLFQHKLVVSF